MQQDRAVWQAPLFFRRNRVFRVYQGGKLFGDFLGDAPEDGNEPEEWICSSVHAINPGHTDPLEGISLRLEDGVPFSALLQEYPRELLGQRQDIGVLVKFLDSAIRLPMQVHPTRAYSREHFGSPYGKAEAWLILAMKTGDVFFVPAGVIHAIGAGCMLLEAQEPTDFTIQPEYWCGEYHLNAQEMYLGLPAETALECFDFTRYGQRVVEQSRKIPRVLREAPGLRVECLIGPEDTSCFSMTRYCLTDGTAALDVPASIWICIEGSGEVTGENYRRALHRGDYFFLPAAAEGYALHGENLQIVCCMGGK